MVPGGTNLGGSIFTVTYPPISVVLKLFDIICQYYLTEARSGDLKKIPILKELKCGFSNISYIFHPVLQTLLSVEN